MGLLEDTLNRIVPLPSETEEEIRTRWNRLYLGLTYMGSAVDMMVHYALSVGETMPEDPEKVLIAPLSEHGAARSFINRETPDNPAFAQMIKEAEKNAAFAGAELSLVDTGLSGEGLRNPHISRQRVAEGTADFTKGAAMTRQQAIRAIESGIEMAGEWIEKGKKLFYLGNLSLGSSMAACGVIAGLKKWNAAEVYRPESWMSKEQVVDAIEKVQQALDANQPDNHSPLDVLMKTGGVDIGFLTGVILGAASRRGAVILDGLSGVAAAYLAFALSESSLQSVMASECFSGNRRQKDLLQGLSLTGVSTLNPVWETGMAAVMAGDMLETVLHIYKECATKEELGVEA